MSIQDFYRWAERHTNLATAHVTHQSHGIKSTPPPQYKLDTMQQLVRLCGNPHHSYSIVHIAGSKGKGTTARIVAEMLASMGYSVGCYLSPHILSYDERFLVLPHGAPEQVKQNTAVGLYHTVCQHNITDDGDNVPAVPDTFNSKWRRQVRAHHRSSYQPSSYQPRIDRNNKHRSHVATDAPHLHDTSQSNKHPNTPFSTLAHATTFELLTLYALLLFKACNCQWVVLECGLGGRLDATNVITPTITAVTSIEKEHTAYLGKTYRKIAAEKGGIIKPMVPVVVNSLRPTAHRVLRAIARRRGAPMVLAKQTLYRQTLRRAAIVEQFMVKSNGTTLPIALHNMQPWNLVNMRMSLTIMRTIFPHYDVSKWNEALHVRLPGRYTTVHDSPQIIVDGAHTPQSLNGVVKAFVNSFGRNTTVVFGCLHDKQITRLIQILVRRFTHYYFVNGPSPRFVAASTLHAIALKKINADTIAHCSLNDALDNAIRHRLPTLVCGSLYLVSEAMQHCTYAP